MKKAEPGFEVREDSETGKGPAFAMYVKYLIFDPTSCRRSCHRPDTEATKTDGQDVISMCPPETL